MTMEYEGDNIYTRARNKAHRKAEYYRAKGNTGSEDGGEDYEREQAEKEGFERGRREAEEEGQRAKEEAYQRGKQEYSQAPDGRRKMTREEAYEYLGLKPNASKDQIKQAYRKLTKVMHPDATGENTGAFMRELIEAYELLGGD
jgi:DnaJ-domain-containing protein 1